MLDQGKMELLRQKALAKNKGSLSVLLDYGNDKNEFMTSARYERNDYGDETKWRYVPDDGCNVITVTNEEAEFIYGNGIADSYEVHRMYNYIVTNPRRNFVLKA